LTAATGVIHGARAAVAAAVRIGFEVTTNLGDAGIVGARVAVVADEGFGTRLADLVGANITQGTGVAVVTGLQVGLVDASDWWFTVIGGADVLIIAVDPT
jgi:hypothetical protein